MSDFITDMQGHAANYFHQIAVRDLHTALTFLNYKVLDQKLWFPNLKYKLTFSDPIKTTFGVSKE